MMVPGRSGLAVLADVNRAKPALPVIILTALGEVDDRVAGLDSGAVDYLTKPFSLKELAARIRAQLRVAAQNRDHHAHRGRYQDRFHLTRGASGRTRRAADGVG